jgi:cytochrome P450
MWQNIKASTVRGLDQVQRIRGFLLGVDPKSLGASEQGSTILLALPAPNYFIVTLDTVLARGVLCGDNGIVEAEKSDLMRFANFIDASQSNMLLHKTANADRESARKAIAPAFSTSNLNRTWPHVKVVLGVQFAEFRQTAASGGTVDCKSMLVRFFLRTLSRGAYDIEFTDDGTENEGNINGLAYLHEIDVCSREAGNQIFIPLRRHMWWASKVRRGALANTRMGEMMGKIVRLHREKGEGGEKHTILDHVVGHKYKSEAERLCDLALTTLAAVETTSYTLCFLLMELSRRPEVKAKLLAALETVMPDRFEAEGAADDASG